MPALLVPVWHYLLAAYCLTLAVLLLHRLPRGVRTAYVLGLQVGFLGRAIALVLGGVGVVAGWDWPVWLAAAALALSMPRYARRFAVGFATGRQSASPAPSSQHAQGCVVPSWVDYATGACFAGVLRGIPALLLLAVQRMPASS